MKRSPGRPPLSRDHQHALDAARRLRRADEATVAEAVRHFLRFFADEGRRQFAIEEELLLPALPADRATPSGRPASSGSSTTTRTSGPPPRRRAAASRERGRWGAARRALRFGARIAFEVLERRLTGPQLERLGAPVDAAERAG